MKVNRAGKFNHEEEEAYSLEGPAYISDSLSLVEGCFTEGFKVTLAGISCIPANESTNHIAGRNELKYYLTLEVARGYRNVN